MDKLNVYGLLANEVGAVLFDLREGREADECTLRTLDFVHKMLDSQSQVHAKRAAAEPPPVRLLQTLHAMGEAGQRYADGELMQADIEALIRWVNARL